MRGIVDLKQINDELIKFSKERDWEKFNKYNKSILNLLFL